MTDDNAGWKPIHRGRGREDISTWVRAEPGMPVKAFRGATDVQYPILHVLAVLADVDAFPRWIFQCKVARRSPDMPENRFYMRFDGIWPVSDRDVYLETTVTQEPGSHAVLDASQEVHHMPETHGCVRIPHLRNQWLLTPLAEGWTKVDFQTLVDPGGMVPGMVADLVATRTPVETLEGLQRQLKQPRYRIQGIDELPEYFRCDGKLFVPKDHRPGKKAV